jgi:hypothetical protein
MAEKIYRPADLSTPEVIRAIEDAKDLWRHRCGEYVVQHGDKGSCVLGAGIVVAFLPPRCRHAVDQEIIAANEATNAQGSCVWEESVRDVIAFLARRGIVARYECGRMD